MVIWLSYAKLLLSTCIFLVYDNILLMILVSIWTVIKLKDLFTWISYFCRRNVFLISLCTKIIQWKYVKYNNNGGRHWTSTFDFCTLMCTPMHKLTVTHTHTTWGGTWGRDSHSQGLFVLELVRRSGMLSTSVSSVLSLICWEHRCVTSTQLSKQVCII